MAPTTVSRISPQEFKAYKVVDERAADIYTLLRRGYVAGKFEYEVTPHPLPDGTSGSRVIFRYLDDTPDKVAYPNYWIIECDDLEISVYDGPTGTALFHENVDMEWAAANTAPSAQVQDERVLITFRQPTSINGPWTYSLTQNSTPVEFSQSMQRVDFDGLILGVDITLSIPKPDPGEYTYVVTADTQFSTSATSLPTTLTIGAENGS